MTLHLTLNDVTRTTSAIIAELGDQFVYESPISGDSSACVYIHPSTGDMSCLVGRVLHRLGAPKEWFKECSVDLLFEAWTQDGLVTLDPGVRGYLTAVQGAQDRHMKYGYVRLVGHAYVEGRRHALGEANE